MQSHEFQIKCFNTNFSVPLLISCELLRTGHITWLGISELRHLAKCSTEVNSESSVLLLDASMEIYIGKCSINPCSHSWGGAEDTLTFLIRSDRALQRGVWELQDPFAPA